MIDKQKDEEISEQVNEEQDQSKKKVSEPNELKERINFRLEEENALLKERIKQLELVNKELLEESMALKKENEDDSSILESLIFPINTIDQIASAYRNQGDNELIAEQLEKVAEMTVQQIANAGIEEIPVYGKEIDGAYMESFGQAQNVIDDTLEPHCVAIVSRRAFKRKDSDEIIQHALVYTVPEEE